MTLSETWFMDGYIDFELQKYRLLSYLQEINKYFTETKLYPQLSDIIFHYNNLQAFRENKKLLQDQFPKQLGQINLPKLELVYEKLLADDEMMGELERITQYALEEMKSTINNGAEIYDFVEKKVHIEPVGIMPLYNKEGYMLLHYGQYAEIRAYSYTVTLFQHQSARYKGIKMDYIDSWQKNLANTFEHVKLDIIRTIRTLPNPAVYSVESSLDVPLNETLLPIAKRMLIRMIEVDKAA